MQNGRPILAIHQASDSPSQRAQLPIISSLWIGQLTPLERLCLQSFVAQGHTFQLYTYDTIDNLPTGVVLADAGQILPASKVFQNQRGAGKGSLAAFSDLFRYKLMVERGGWWVDTDVFCLKAFDFAAPYVFGAEDKPVATGIIKMPRGCDLAEHCYKSACRVNRKKIIWNELAVILEHGVRELDLMSYVLPPETFSPIMWNEVPDYVRGEKLYTPGPRSYAVHLYNEMWRRNNLDKWGTYPPNSALNVLRKLAGVENEKPIARPTVPFQLPAAPRQSRLAQLWPFRRAA
jgi:hypothetical protein